MASAVKRRIKKANITHVSLVRRGANDTQVVYKSAAAGEGQEFEVAALTKYDAEQGILYGLVYPVERFDSQGDIAARDVVKQMAHEFVPNGAHVDLDHDLKALSRERAHVAETFIVQKGDPRFAGLRDYAGQPVDATDGWGIAIKLNDPALRERAKSGDLGGVSMYGKAQVDLIQKSDVPTEKTDMTPQELQAALAANNAALATVIVKALKEGDKPADPPAPKLTAVIKFEGDMNKPEDVAKHAEKVLFMSLDMGKPEDIAKWQAHLAAKTKTPEPKKDESPELKKAREDAEKATNRVKELEKTSNVPPKGDEPGATLTKMEAGRALGRKMAEDHNKANAKGGLRIVPKQ